MPLIQPDARAQDAWRAPATVVGTARNVWMPDVHALLRAAHLIGAPEIVLEFHDAEQLVVVTSADAAQATRRRVVVHSAAS